MTSWQKDIEEVLIHKQDELNKKLIPILLGAKIEANLQPLPPDWHLAVETYFRHNAYVLSMLDCMRMAFALGRAWQKYEDELKEMIIEE